MARNVPCSDSGWSFAIREFRPDPSACTVKIDGSVSSVSPNDRLRRVTESRIRGELERKDPSGSGVVSEQALGKVLGKLGADLAGADLSRLMHRFDIHEVCMYSCNTAFVCLLCFTCRSAALPERGMDRSGSHVVRSLRKFFTKVFPDPLPPLCYGGLTRPLATPPTHKPI